MSSNPQTDPPAQKADALPPAQSGGNPQSFTPEELRKAARAQVILYIVMAIFIVLPFIVMWLRGSGSAATQEATAQQNGAGQEIVIE